MLLLVEANEDGRVRLHALLSEAYHIVDAADGREGIERAARIMPDIVLSAVHLPGVSGFQLCRSLKQARCTCHIPVVLLLPGTNNPARLDALRHGADASLCRPIAPEELSLQLANLIELRRTLRRFNRLRPAAPVALCPENRADDGVFLRKLHQSVLAHLDEPDFDLQILCREVQMSRTQLYRKLKELTSQSVAKYVRSVRLGVARHLLETTALSIGEVAFRVGFRDQSYFTRTFVGKFGVRPREVR